MDRIELLQKTTMLHAVGSDPPTSSQGDGGQSTCQRTQQARTAAHEPTALDEAYQQVQRIRFREDEDLMDDREGQFAHLFHRTQDYANALVDANNPFEERRQIARIWNVEEQEILAIHPVLHPPDDLQGRVLITRWQRDNHFRVFETDVQVLFDVELHSGEIAQPAVKLFRHVEWTRHTMTRTDILSTVYVRDYCRLLAADTCLVWVNQQLWALQDTDPRQPRAGDFIRVAVPAQQRRTADDLRETLQHAEQSAREHTHYYPHADTSNEDQEESEESAHTQYGRSPSVSEPEPLDSALLAHHGAADLELARDFAHTTSCWGLSKLTIDLFLLFGVAHGALTVELPVPLSWDALSASLLKHFSDLIHYDIVFHPVLAGMERWRGRCRIVVEISRVAVRPLHTHRVPALMCSKTRPSQLQIEDSVIWKALYIPRHAELFGRWKQAYEHVIWHEGDHHRPGLPGMLLYEQSAQEAQGLIPSLLQDVSTPIINLHCDAVALDGRALGRRTGHFPIWSLTTKDQIHHYCLLLWPEMFGAKLYFPSNGYSTHAGPDGFPVLLSNSEPPVRRNFWCSITLTIEDQDVANFHAAVGIPWPCTLRELRARLGFHSPHVDSLLDSDTLLPELCDGDHLHLRGALRQQQSTRELVHTPMNPLDIESWQPVGFLHRPPSEPIRLNDVIEGNHYKPPRWTGSQQEEEKVEGIDFRDVLALWEWLDASSPEVTWSLPENTNWHPTSTPWTGATWWSLDKADEIAIYTDGSATADTSSAAAVFFVRISRYWHYAGYLKQDLHGKACAHKAELCGLILGYHWLNCALRRLALLQGLMPAISFRFDSTTAGYKAAGVWSGTSYPYLQTALRALEHFVSARFQVAIAFEHVRGHWGDPGNEAANTVANIRGTSMCFEHSVWCKAFQVNTPAEIQWLWALWKPEWQGLWRDGVLRCNMQPATTADPTVFNTHPDLDCPTEINAEAEQPVECFQLNIVSANV